MIILPSQVTESFAPITAGIIVSLINKYIINSTSCESYKTQEVDSESDCDATTKTQLSDSLSRTSSMAAMTLPTHPIHVHYVHH